MRIVRRALTILALMLAFAGTSDFSSVASACPNCKFANETESKRPRAYMYSILFMIGMPATIFTGFGIGFYRMARKAQLVSDHADAAGSVAEDHSEPA